MSDADQNREELQKQELQELLKEFVDFYDPNDENKSSLFDSPSLPLMTKKSSNNLQSRNSSLYRFSSANDDRANPFVSRTPNSQSNSFVSSGKSFGGNKSLIQERVAPSQGIRLKPLLPFQGAESENINLPKPAASEEQPTSLATPLPPPGIKPNSGRLGISNLAPLPTHKWDFLIPEGGTEVLLPIELKQREVNDQEVLEKSASVDPIEEKRAPSSHKVTADPEPVEPKETNFLPMMCAQYLNCSGLSPPPRWGHTLTALGNGKLYLFGGMEENGNASNLLMEFDASTTTWEPVYVMSGDPPSARFHHAACAYDKRYLIVCGGISSHGVAPVGMDIYSYDTQLQKWECLWQGQSKKEKNEPPARLGHTAVCRGDKLYLLGGKSSGGNAHHAKSSRTADSAMDIYVFSLVSKAWKKKIRSDNASDEGVPTAPSPRAYHAACLLGDSLFVNGGEALGKKAEVLSDTWRIDLKQGKKWVCAHPGGSADAFPREKHALYACGEALLVLGGCGQSAFSDRIASKFNTSVAVLPLIGWDCPCWLPMSMGNGSIIAPNRIGFGSAISGGFVYLLGGTCNSEFSSSAIIRFLAADGETSEELRESQLANNSLLRGAMQRLQRNPMFPHDTYVVPGSYGGIRSSDYFQIQKYGCYHALLKARAPHFFRELKECRHENVSNSQDTVTAALDNSHFNELVRLRGATASPTMAKDKLKLINHQANTAQRPARSTGTPAIKYNYMVYYCEGNSRVKGLSAPMTASQVECFLDYLYWGGLRSEFKSLLDQEEENANKDDLQNREKERLRDVLAGVCNAAKVYRLEELEDLCDALLKKDRAKMTLARERSAKRLKSDLASLLESEEDATMTLLLVDPHTKRSTSAVVHPFMLACTSSFFADLLRPIIGGTKTRFEIGNVSVKLANSVNAESLPLATSKRSIMVGPISIPSQAIQSVLNFLYTFDLSVALGAALPTMLGSHTFRLPLLQSYCESIIAREEVNYETCCSFYYLARQHSAPLLEEISLLTAVLGFSQVGKSVPFNNLPDQEKKYILSLVDEVGSESCINPPKPQAELKSAEEYAKRWRLSKFAA